MRRAEEEEQARAAAAEARRQADPTAHYAVFKAPNVLKDTIKSFVDNTFTTSLPGIAGASGGGGGAQAVVDKPAGLAK